MHPPLPYRLAIQLRPHPPSITEAYIHVHFLLGWHLPYVSFTCISRRYSVRVHERVYNNIISPGLGGGGALFKLPYAIRPPKIMPVHGQFHVRMRKIQIFKK